MKVRAFAVVGSVERRNLLIIMHIASYYNAKGPVVALIRACLAARTSNDFRLRETRYNGLPTFSRRVLRFLASGKAKQCHFRVSFQSGSLVHHCGLRIRYQLWQFWDSSDVKYYVHAYRHRKECKTSYEFSSKFSVVK